MKKITFTILFFLIFPIFVLAQSTNVGIIKGIWFSEDIFFADDPIRIYTAIQNNSGDDIEGIVEFFDNDISIGKKNFTSLNARISEVWMDSIISEGEHNYSVQITEALINRPGEANEIIIPRVIESDETLVADVDTDGDNTGDAEDLDDDDDGFSDKEEEEEGTDPLDESSIPNTEDNKNTNEEAKDTTLIQEIINSIIGTNSTDTDNDSLDVEDITNNSSEIDLQSIQLPTFAKNIEQEYPIAGKVTQPLSTIQNIMVPKISQEQDRITNILKPEISLETKSESTLLPDNINTPAQNTGWRYWVNSIYSWVLSAFLWIFSCLLCTIILLFILLHLILKLLFFGGRRLFNRN
jgi:hypothetical protein